MRLKGLTDNTRKQINAISQLRSINDFTLIGGTALSLQIENRLSEDLDFCKWTTSLKSDKPTVDWFKIENELKTIGEIEKKDILGFEHVNFIMNGVKLSFFAKQYNLSPLTNKIKIINNIVVADIEAIGIMKIEVCMRRSNFRDYYDIYSILKKGISLKKIIQKAVKYSNYTLKTRDALHFLTDGKRFKIDKSFELLQAIYDITPNEIEVYIKNMILKEYPKK